MELISGVVIGLLLFFALVFAVILFGAAGNKREKDLRELTTRERAAGLTGDVTMNDRRGPSDYHYDDDRSVPV